MNTSPPTLSVSRERGSSLGFLGSYHGFGEVLRRNETSLVEVFLNPRRTSGSTVTIVIKHSTLSRERQNYVAKYVERQDVLLGEHEQNDIAQSDRFRAGA